MKLYHFCPAHLLKRIKKDGLTMGMIPFIENGELKHIKGYQWLTLNSSFVQLWEKDSNLSYRRNAYRITVKIPKNKLINLMPWDTLSKIDRLKETADLLNHLGTPENWYIFRGRIKPGWFRDIDKNKSKE